MLTVKNPQDAEEYMRLVALHLGAGWSSKCVDAQALLTGSNHSLDYTGPEGRARLIAALVWHTDRYHAAISVRHPHAQRGEYSVAAYPTHKNGSAELSGLRASSPSSTAKSIAAAFPLEVATNVWAAQELWLDRIMERHVRAEAVARTLENYGFERRDTLGPPTAGAGPVANEPPRFSYRHPALSETLTITIERPWVGARGPHAPRDPETVTMPPSYPVISIGVDIEAGDIETTIAVVNALLEAKERKA